MDATGNPVASGNQRRATRHHQTFDITSRLEFSLEGGRSDHHRIAAGPSPSRRGGIEVADPDARRTRLVRYLDLDERTSGIYAWWGEVPILIWAISRVKFFPKKSSR